MSSNQDHNSHIMYQPAYAAYPATQSMGTWGQPAAQQPYAYTTYPQNDRTAYPDTTGYPNQQYQQVPYGGAGDGDYYRSSGYYTQQNQWQQPAYTTFTPANQAVFSAPGYSGTDREQPRATYSAAAQLPNMSRPPPNIKRENGDNTFHASLSLLENPAQASAAYTASWVSNTSRIPPDMKEEPEMFPGVPAEPIATPVFNQNFGDQFGRLSLVDGAKADPNIRKGEDRRAPRDETPTAAAKQLTWEERIRKANVQKERAEQRGSGERLVPERERPERENVRTPVVNVQKPRGNMTGTRGGPRDGRDNRQQRSNGLNGMPYKNNNGDHNQDRNARGGGNMRILPGIMRGPDMPLMVNPNVPHMMYQPRMPFVPGPPNAPYQDERFKNTWLDANVYAFPMPYGPMGSYPMNGSFRGNNRGRGGRGGFRGFPRRGGDQMKRDDDRQDHGDEPAPQQSPISASSLENAPSAAVPTAEEGQTTA